MKDFGHLEIRSLQRERGTPRFIGHPSAVREMMVLKAIRFFSAV
jgi:hypothetical protein